MIQKLLRTLKGVLNPNFLNLTINRKKIFALDKGALNPKNLRMNREKCLL